jgi:hypothetical protein
MTSPGPEGDALQQIGGNKAAEHDASSTMAFDKMTQNATHFDDGDGLMNPTQPPAACSQAGYIRFCRPSGENFEQSS